MTNNTRIRVLLVERGLHQYDLARLLNISESTCSRLLREELSLEQTSEIERLIKGEDND